MKLRTIILTMPLIITCSMAFAGNTIPVTTTTIVTSTETTQSSTKMPLSTILQQLKTAGFVCVKEIQMENGIYEAMAMNKSGKAFKLDISPQTGTVLKETSVTDMDKKMMKNMPKVSIQQAALNIEKAGYVQIKEIEGASQRDFYKAEAIDAKGTEVDLKVNKKTGVVS